MKKVLTVLVAVTAMATFSASAFAAGCGSNIGRNAPSNPGTHGTSGPSGGVVQGNTTNQGFKH